MLTLKYVVVEWRVPGNQRAFKRRDRFDQVVKRDSVRHWGRRCVVRKRTRECRAIVWVCSQHAEHSRLAPGQALLHWMLIQQRLEHLLLERDHFPLRPTKADVVSLFVQRHGAATPRLPYRTNCQ